MKKNTQHSGFTLIELMITAAIVAILAAIAIPSYTEQVYKAKRSTASQVVLECASILERRYTLNQNYDSDACDSLVNDDYTIAVSVTGLTRNGRNCTANSKNNCFLISATPTNPGGAAGDDKCQQFTLEETGARNSKNGTGVVSTDTCWRT